jgi:hypothetical protein
MFGAGHDEAQGDHRVKKLPEALPGADLRWVNYDDFARKCLKGLVGAQGLEPWTR